MYYINNNDTNNKMLDKLFDIRNKNPELETIFHYDQLSPQVNMDSIISEVFVSNYTKTDDDYEFTSRGKSKAIFVLIRESMNMLIKTKEGDISIDLCFIRSHGEYDEYFYYIEMIDGEVHLLKPEDFGYYLKNS